MELTLYDLILFIQQHFRGVLEVIIVVGAILIEKSKTIKFNPITWLGKKIGNLLTIGVLEKVEAMDNAREERSIARSEKLHNEIMELSEEIHNEIKSVKEENDRRHLFNEADRIHDEILLQADKMRQSSKFPLEERAKVLYNKVLRYEELCKILGDDYKNGVCVVACNYIKDWFIRNYHNDSFGK